MLPGVTLLSDSQREGCLQTATRPLHSYPVLMCHRPSDPHDPGVDTGPTRTRAGSHVSDGSVCECTHTLYMHAHTPHAHTIHTHALYTQHTHTVYTCTHTAHPHNTHIVHMHT